MRLFSLYHGIYVKGTGLYLQRPASAFECVLRGATGDVVVVGRAVVSKGGEGVDDSTRRRRRDGGKLTFDILYIFIYNADLDYINDIMRPRIFIGDWNSHSLDDISLLIRCYYLFALLHHVVAVVIGKIVFVGS